jgi:hypothetical protein
MFSSEVVSGSFQRLFVIIAFDYKAARVLMVAAGHSHEPERDGLLSWLGPGFCDTIAAHACLVCCAEAERKNNQSEQPSV